MMKKRTSLIIMSLLYIAAGINHFWHTAFYVSIMPAWMPYHVALVYLSGVCEIIFGVMLLFNATRKAAAWLIIAMLVIFLTVHVDMIIKAYAEMGIVFWIAMIRLPLQFVLMKWAYDLRNTKAPIPATEPNRIS